jgi:hypothetical protein
MITKGLQLPTSKGMISSNPSSSAYQATQNNANTAGSLKAAVGGGRRRKKSNRFKGGKGIEVPQYQMGYSPQNGPGQDPNSIIADSSATSTQSASWSKYDKNATMNGGRGGRGGRMNGSCMNGSCMDGSCMNGSCMNGSCMNGCKSHKKKKKRSRKKKLTKRNKRSNKYRKIFY